MLRPGWSAATGVVLLLSLLAGAAGALALLRAANGRPAVVGSDAVLPAEAADHAEALGAARALQAGIVLVFACALLLTAAVGLTWYGPARDAPAIEVQTRTGVVCGTLAASANGAVTIVRDGQRTTIALADVVALRQLAACPNAAAGVMPTTR